MELHPVMQKILLSLSSQVILPFTKRVYHQIVEGMLYLLQLTLMLNYMI
jgi:hypothetical protein